MRNLKKVIALIAVFAMVMSTVAFAATFDDVTEDNSYYEAIQTLNKLGILTGDDENGDGVMSFRPEDTITRAEIAVIVSRIQGTTGAVAQTNTIFTDVPSTHWASGYIAAATNQGIINGYGDGTFGPDDSVKYEEVIKMLMETLGYKYYAQSNGGYPTGYIIAAQRQDVLDGVVGGAEGTDATRGQVAQMTNNAIDTPLMDRIVYGGTDQYVIYDGTDYVRKTLMSQDLGIIKVAGVVTETNITGLSTDVSIDTDTADQITLSVRDNFGDTSNADYEYSIATDGEGNESTPTIYVGDSDAADYLGYDCTVYVTNSKTDSDTVLSITPTQDRNNTTTFNVADYDSIDTTSSNKNQIKYMKNETDRSATNLNVDTDAPVIYNGRYIGEGTSGLNEVFNDSLIYADCAWSGEVTVLDNDQNSGYDVVFVNVAAGGVVDELSSRGVVTFKNSVGDRNSINSLSKVEFNSSDTDQIVVLTKDGEPYDYTALKEWDVLSIIYNSDGDGDYIVAEVLDGDATKIEGTVSRTSSSDTSAEGVCYTINGVDYDAAYNYYSNGNLKAGSAGAFYIDKYGKIVAYNKDGSASTTSDNYAYVLNYTLSSSFDDNVPSLSILYKDGSIQTVDFASSVTVENPSAKVIAAADGDSNDDSVTLKYSDCDVDTLDEILDELVGRVITISATGGYIKNITMAYGDSTGQASTSIDADQTLNVEAAGDSTYDEDIQEIRVNGKKFDLADDALVFVIGRGSDDYSYQTKTSGADTDSCKVMTGSSITDFSSTKQAVVYSNGNGDGDLDVLVLYNSSIGAGESSAICYVTAVGSASDDGSKVLSVSYYQNGELKTALTDSTVIGDLSASTLAGSLFKFGMSGDKITDATSMLVFNGDSVRDRVYEDDDFESVGIPNVSEMDSAVNNNSTSSDEELYYGAVIEKSGSKLTLATTDSAGLPSLSDIETINMSKYTTNYYLYDPTRSSSAKFQLGSLGDIYCDKVLAQDGGDGSYTISFGDKTGTTGTPAWGMLDYAFIRLYDNTADVIDYTTWEYDYDYSR